MDWPAHLAGPAVAIHSAPTDRVGYGGNSITFSMIAAQILRGHIASDGDADSDLFSFTRKF